MSFIILDIIVLIISIVIPLLLVSLNQTGSCLHHIEEGNGNLWVLGRALGFTTLIWFIISTLFGVYTKKLARVFSSYSKARDFHCLNASITIIIFLTHISSLLTSDPWGSLVFDGKYNHIPYNLFMIKLWTGVIFGIIMFSVFLSAFYFRNMENMKKFGFRNFIKLHYIMLSLSIILAVHIFLINTELLIIFWG
ncbi:MAG: hypothetical protein ACFFA6_08490 [Promethearchaeota archaeon]